MHAYTAYTRTLFSRLEYAARADNADTLDLQIQIWFYVFLCMCLCTMGRLKLWLTGCICARHCKFPNACEALL